MALSATVHRIKIALSDVDRGVYESLDLRVARHPSETARAVVVRSLAYALFYEEGIAFSQGLSSADDPAIWVRDPTGVLQVWIDIGSPTADRLHRASKAAPRVVIVCHHDIGLFLKEARSRAVHRAESIEVYAITPSLLTALETALDRNTSWDLTRTDNLLYATVDGKVFEGALTQHNIVDENAAPVGTTRGSGGASGNTGSRR